MASRLHQCLSCPWRVGCVPEQDIPHGYSRALHENLRGTLVSGYAPTASMRIMACHHSQPGTEITCAGWLHHQLGVGNNIAVRIAVARGRLPVPVVDGDQHQTFDATLPKD